MERKIYFYFYKITNEINGMYYYGVHSTTKLDDGYMGSGHYLQRAQQKYGLQNFKKEILKFFESRDEMMNYEHDVVNTQMINKDNPMCYNIVRGGWGSHKDHITNSLKGTKRDKEAIRKSLETKEIRGTYKRLSQENVGYNNPEFIGYWKDIYEEDMSEIVNLILTTDLSDDFIVKKIFNKKVKTFKLIKYYEYLGLLIDKQNGEMKPRFVNYERKGNFLHQSPNTLKSLYKNSNVRPTAIYLPEYFNIVNELLIFINDTHFSDSMLINYDKENKTTYCDAIKYLSYVGILKNKGSIKIKVPLVRKTPKGDKDIERVSTKTLYELDYGAASSTILFDKEFNKYVIENNGRVVQKGRLREL